MKRSVLRLALASLLLFASRLQAQDIYSTTGGELIFSFADVSQGGAELDDILRFTAFFHLGEYWHLDANDNFGFFTGFGVRNVGMITDEGNDRLKRRSYAAGIPLAVKLGSFSNNLYFFAGGEAELMFHYKEKRFVDGDRDRKEKFNEWFSDRTNLINPSLFAGIQFPKGLNVRFKYYLLDFLNQDFTETIDGIEVRPYEGLSSQIFYISLSYNLRHEWGAPARDWREF